MTSNVPRPEREQPRQPRTWILAAILCLLAGIATWFWTGLNLSPRKCVGGYEDHSSLYPWGLLLLALAGPITLAWRGRRQPQVLLAAVACLFGSVIAVFFGAQLWWAHYNCYS